MGLPRGALPVWTAAAASAGEAGIEMGDGSGAAAKSAKSVGMSGWSSIAPVVS